MKGAPGPRPARAWQRMLSGRRLDLFDPSPLDIEFDDIAHGLARVARWNGQTRGDHIFSVAQHSLLVELLAAETDPGLPMADRLAILLHDAAEYVIGDLISPLKAMIGEGYGGVEARLLEAIRLRAGLPAKPAPAFRRRLKAADRAAAHLEAVTLAGFAAAEAREFFGPIPAVATERLGDLLTAWPAGRAGDAFRRRLSELGAP